MVSCSGVTCTVTLGGSGARAHVLGATISFESIHEGRATLRVGDRTVSCTQGDTVLAGPLRLTCTAVAPDTVTLTVSPG